MFELIEHVWNKDLVLEEAYRVLEPHGVFIITTPNLVSWASRILLLLGKCPLHYGVSLKRSIGYRYGHISLYTLDLLKTHLSKVGFRILDIRGILMPWYFRNKLVLTASVLVAKVKPSLAADMLVVAEKPT